MAHAPYDPVKAHAYYEQHKKLTGRESGAPKTKGGSPTKKTKNVQSGPKANEAKARVGRLRAKISKLVIALGEVEAELSKKRQTKRKSDKKNSDGKTTAAERQASKAYRDAHKQQLATKHKHKDAKSGGSSGGSGSNISSMSVDELESRATKIRALIKEARRQLSNANQELGQLAHSAIRSEPNINELFAQFQSAERIPSK